MSARVTVPVVMPITLALSAAPARSIDAATVDDTARFLAGLQPSSNSLLAALAKDPAWLSHARYFDAMFAREESAHLSKVREFSKEYLTEKHDTMLYMFGGPDFLYANSFFPNASIYVLAGLEPVGEIPDLTGLSSWAIDEELRNLENSMDSLFSFSFFITQKMKVQRLDHLPDSITLSCLADRSKGLAHSLIGTLGLKDWRNCRLYVSRR